MTPVPIKVSALFFLICFTTPFILPSVAVTPTDSSGDMDGTGSELQYPRLLDFRVWPTEIQSSYLEPLSFALRVADETGGFESGRVFVRSPSGSNDIEIGFDVTDRVSGDQFNGWYSVSDGWRYFKETGEWTIQVFLTSQGGNERNLLTEDLADRGFQSLLQVEWGGVIPPILPGPPVLHDLEINPAEIDVDSATASDIVVKFRAEVQSGSPLGVSARFVSPSGAQSKIVEFFCTAPDSYKSFPFDFPRHSEPGEWVLESLSVGGVSFNRMALQSLGFPTSIQVISAMPDLEPPSLTHFELFPELLVLDQQPETVTMNLRIVDPLSGFTSGGISLMNDAADFTLSAQIEIDDRVSGDKNDGWYRALIEVPIDAALGDWRVWWILLKDETGNATIIHETNLDDRGLPRRVTVRSTSVRLELVDLTVDQETVDVSHGDPILTFTARIKATEPGADFVRLDLLSPSGHSAWSELTLISGSPADGIYTGAILLAQHSEPGDWVLRLRLNGEPYNEVYQAADLAALGFPSTVHVVSATPDLHGPELLDLKFSPDLIIGGPGGRTLRLHLRIADELRGFSRGLIGLTKGTFLDLMEWGGVFESPNRTSGDALDGIYVVDWPLPEDLSPGLWELHLELWDGLNATWYSAPELHAMGMPATLLVETEKVDFNRWAQLHGLTGLFAEWNGDPGAQGIPMAKRYAFGMPPKKTELERLPSLNSNPSGAGDGNFALTYTRSRVANDLVWLIEQSDDLATWVRVDLPEVISTADDPESETVTVLISQPPEERRFFRVRAERK